MSKAKKKPTLGIAVKPNRAGMREVLKRIGHWCLEHEIPVILEHAAAEDWTGAAAESMERTEMADKVDAVLVLGGDGTLLSVARSMEGKQVPIMGINLGHLGFLTSAGPGELVALLDAWLQGLLIQEEKLVLRARVVRRGRRVGPAYAVLNDVVVAKSALARLAPLSLAINNHHVMKLRADGMIVSTPTGATAYSMSAGGPILAPPIGAVVITPICPHTLTVRPMVVSARSEISLTVEEGGPEVHLTVDGQVGMPLKPGDTVNIKKSSRKVILLRMPDRDLFAILRDKLGWGEIKGGVWDEN